MTVTTGMRRRLMLAASISVLTLGALAAPGATLAKHGNDTAVIRTGSCTGSADWKLKLKHEDGGIEVEFEVDQNKNGKTWDVSLKQDGNSFWSGPRTTHAPSGSFEVSRVTTNKAGVHQFIGRAVSRANGQVCRGTASI